MDHTPATSESRLDISQWRNVPIILMAIGAVISLIGAAFFTRQFAYAWLLAFMFFLSLCLGSLFLILAHHLFDDGRSVAIRRFCEHIASLLFPWMALLFLPVGLLAKTIYPWMSEDPRVDQALAAKQPLFTMRMFYVVDRKSTR